MRAIVLLFLHLVAGLGLCARAEEAKPLFSEDFSRGLGKAWKPLNFTGLTEYKILSEGTNFFVSGHAAQTASGLIRELKLKPKGHLKLQWRWKIDRCPPGGSETNVTTFDHTARIFIAFDTFIGPARSVNYVWANQLKVGATFHHPNSDRARFVVLQHGDERAGQWITETRDVTADWERLFGSSPPPGVVAIGFMTDADGTKTDVTGCYGPILLFEE